MSNSDSFWIHLSESACSVVANSFVTLWTMCVGVHCSWDFLGKNTDGAISSSSSLPDPGSDMSPALAGGFITTDHLGIHASSQ